MSINSKMNSYYSRRLARVVCCTLSVFAVGLLTASSEAKESDADHNPVQVNLTAEGVLSGRVVTMLDSEEAPVVARVSLTADGVTVATRTTDVVGNFSFEDVQPGAYKMVGVSGEYVGGQSIVVGEAVEGAESDFELRVSTVATTTVAPFANAPMSAYSPAIVSGSGYSSACNSCSTCGSGGGGYGGGIGGGGIGSGGLGGGRIGRGLFGASSLRRLALIGGAVVIPVALSASPDE